MGPVDIQFTQLQQSYPTAVLRKLGDGTAVVTIPGLPLETGWNRDAVTVYFVAPVGYPMSRPDSFWVDGDLRLHNGELPKNTGAQPLPGIDARTLWFSWHATSWNPNSDDLRTYLRFIKKRLARVE